MEREQRDRRNTDFKVSSEKNKDLKSLIWTQIYFLTSTPLSWPCWPHHLLLDHAWEFQRECPDPAPLGAHWDSQDSRSPCPSPWMVAVAEEGPAPSPVARSSGTLYICIAKPFSPLFSFQPQSGCVQTASCPWPGAQTPDRDRDRKHEPKIIPGTTQPCGSLQASPGHEAVILFLGTQGAWMLCWP